MSGSLVLLPIIAGILGGLIIAFIPEANHKLRNRVALITSVIGAIFVWALLPMVLKGNSPVIQGNIGQITWKLQPDPLGMVFALISSTLWVFTAIYTFGYMGKKHNQRSFFSFYLISLSVTLGIAFSANILLLYVFYELLTFTTYPLVIHNQDKDSIKAGNQYIAYNLIGASFILVSLITAAIWTGGDLNLTSIPLLASVGSKPGMLLILLSFIIGFGVKAAIMPLHHWLPGAMVAPTPVSALLHAVAVVNAGIFGLIRVIYSVFGYNVIKDLGIAPFLLIVICFTILSGSWVALRQDVLKRRLAYSTISQLSYILLGALTLHPIGLTGAIVHMINHSLLKITLFFNAGIIDETTGNVKVSQLKGVGKRLPLVFASFGLASIGMIGMLPMNGFWSKYYLMQGGIVDGSWMLLLVLFISGILNGIYFLPIVVNGFIGTERVTPFKFNKEQLLMLVPTCILVIFALVLGLWPKLIQPLTEAVINQFFNL